MTIKQTLYDSNFEALSDVALSGDYNDLLNLPTLGTAAAQNIGFFATAAQGALADTAEQSANKGQANGYASLDGGGKVPASQLPNSVMEFQGAWNASTNTPTLANGSGNPGDVYQASVAGTVDFGAGNITFAAGDFVIYGASGVWSKSVNSNAVASVNGYTGVVVLTKSDVGLGNVDNTSDLNKPISTATQSALDLKANISSLADVATSGDYNDLLNLPTLGTAAAQNISYFALASHTHVISDVTGLQTALDARARKVSPPATATSTGQVNDFATDANYLYICTATDTWQRVPISTW